MKPSLQFRLSQHLTLTPQLQQSIRLLQLSTVELNQEIERILMENPALEREEHDGEHAAGGDEVAGNYIFVDQRTDFFSVTAGKAPQGRVRATIQPKAAEEAKK